MVVGVCMCVFGEGGKPVTVPEHRHQGGQGSGKGEAGMQTYAITEPGK